MPSEEEIKSAYATKSIKYKVIENLEEAVHYSNDCPDTYFNCKYIYILFLFTIRVYTKCTRMCRRSQDEDRRPVAPNILREWYSQKQHTLCPAHIQFIYTHICTTTYSVYTCSYQCTLLSFIKPITLSFYVTTLTTQSNVAPSAVQTESVKVTSLVSLTIQSISTKKLGTPSLRTRQSSKSLALKRQPSSSTRSTYTLFSFCLSFR